MFESSADEALPRTGLLAAAILAVAAGLAAPDAPGEEPQKGVVIEVLPAGQTGLGQIMARWKAAERVRQGGTFGSHGWWPWGLTAFDFDNDGDLDLMPTHHGTPRGMILKSLLKETGKLTFVDVTRQLGLDTRDLPIADALPHVWDFDGDGWLDIAGFSDETRCPCLFNRGGKRFVVADFHFQPISYLGEVRDVNGDGYGDVLATRRGMRYTFLFDPKAKTFHRQSEKVLPPGNLPAATAAVLAEMRKTRKNRFMRVRYLTGHDLNGDGLGDLVVQVFGAYGGSRAGHYLLADAAGGLIDRTDALHLPAEGVPVLLADVSADGAVDVLVASSGRAGLYLGDGRGGFRLAPGAVTDFLKGSDPYLHKAHVVDLDNDTDGDLVLEKPRTGQLGIFENRGGGEFALVRKARKWDAYPTVICDLNDDGLMDVVAGGPGKEEITVYLNRTPAAGNFCKLSPRMARPNWAAIGTEVEVFRAGTLAAPARPMLTAKAHIDGRAIHVGLGAARRFDLRATFPGRAALELRNVAAAARLTVLPDGKLLRGPPP